MQKRSCFDIYKRDFFFRPHYPLPKLLCSSFITSFSNGSWMLDIYCGIRYYHLQVRRRGKQHKSGGKQGNLHRQQHAANIIHASLTFSLKQRRCLKVLQVGVMLLQTRLSPHLTPEIHSCVSEMNSWHWIKRPFIKMAAARACWSTLYWR